MSSSLSNGRERTSTAGDAGEMEASLPLPVPLPHPVPLPPSEHHAPTGVRIGHVHFHVADLHRAVRFYRTILGFQITMYGPAFGLPVIFLSSGDYHHEVALNTFDPATVPPPDRHGGLQHVAFLYPTTAALSGIVQRLYDFDWPIDSASDHGGSLSVYLRDPDGNGIELTVDRPRAQWYDDAGRLVLKNQRIDPRLIAEGRLL